MKNFFQATGWLATALLFSTGCELPKDENTPPNQTIVYLGHLIQSARSLYYKGFFPIAGDVENKSGPQIFEVDLNLPNRRIQFFGKKEDSSSCYFSRVLTDNEHAKTLELLKSLEFCELRSNVEVDCLGCYFPSASVSIDSYSDNFWIDPQSSYCSPGYPELCNSQDFNSITELIKPLADGELMNCQ